MPFKKETKHFFKNVSKYKAGDIIDAVVYEGSTFVRLSKVTELNGVPTDTGEPVPNPGVTLAKMEMLYDGEMTIPEGYHEQLLHEETGYQYVKIS